MLWLLKSFVISYFRLLFFSTLPYIFLIRGVGADVPWVSSVKTFISSKFCVINIWNCMVWLTTNIIRIKLSYYRIKDTNISYKRKNSTELLNHILWTNRSFQLHYRVAAFIIIYFAHSVLSLKTISWPCKFPLLTHSSLVLNFRITFSDMIIKICLKSLKGD